MAEIQETLISAYGMLVGDFSADKPARHLVGMNPIVEYCFGKIRDSAALAHSQPKLVLVYIKARLPSTNMLRYHGHPVGKDQKVGVSFVAASAQTRLSTARNLAKVRILA